jgi:hypothetical protein
MSGNSNLARSSQRKRDNQERTVLGHSDVLEDRLTMDSSDEDVITFTHHPDLIFNG